MGVKMLGHDNSNPEFADKAYLSFSLRTALRV